MSDHCYGCRIQLRKKARGLRAAVRSDRIILSNRDRTYPKEDGVYSGCGAIVASILEPAGRQADAVSGKPETNMMQYVSDLTGFGPDEMVMIGGGLESVIAMAKAYGSPSIYIGAKIRGLCCYSALADVDLSCLDTDA